MARPAGRAPLLRYRRQPTLGLRGGGRGHCQHRDMAVAEHLRFAFVKAEPNRVFVPARTEEKVAGTWIVKFKRKMRVA